jgi:spermidine synthase
MSTECDPALTAVLPKPGLTNNIRTCYLLFFFSGFPALLYQIVWQRALFTIYGVNIESVTVIVTVFMLGLGLGSLAGGWLSKRPHIPLLGVFGGIELAIGTLGMISLKAFHTVALVTAGAPPLQTGLVTFSLLLLPTLLMGSTLPLLVAYLVSRNGNVGESVGALYAVNTFGSAVACFAAANFLMHWLGESGSVRAAALINVTVATIAFVQHARNVRIPVVSRAHATAPRRPAPVLSFSQALLLAAAFGFISLGYEIVWYRIYSFVSGRTAASFASLLGWYLAGVAYGSLVVRDLCRGKLRSDSAGLMRAVATTVLWGNIAAFLVAPFLALSSLFNLILPVVFIGAALLGAAFPLISHASIDPGECNAGARLSYLYLSNILGSAAGSFTVGFVLMEHFSVKAISFGLLSIGVMLACGLVMVGRRHLVNWPRAIGVVVALLVAGLSWNLYSTLYERLLFKANYSINKKFSQIVETRSGVVTVTSDGTVYGGGVYDGHVSTDLVADVNGIFRVFAIDALHPSPKEILVIGLSVGSWTQVLANNTRVTKITVVEINPGYLQLISKYPAVSSLLRNPKVDIVIDDGRRWLVRNPKTTFDVIVMNTSQHWLAHQSNLLSAEFLRLIRPHLKPGGIHYYNTTFSPEAMLTGTMVFPYALRVGNCLAVSDSPITFDKERWRAALGEYRIDGEPVFDQANPLHRARLQEVVGLADTLYDGDVTNGMRIEAADTLRRRFAGASMITDDNMGAEWRF